MVAGTVMFALKVSMERVMHMYVCTYVWGVMAHVSLECTFPFAELQSSPVTLVQIASFTLAHFALSIKLLVLHILYIRIRLYRHH